MTKPCPPLDATMRERLEARLGRLHLNQRLGIETEYEARIFGQGRNFFHLENWYSAHGLLRGALRLMGLHGRGRRNARAIQVRHNTINLPQLPAVFDGFRILHISDPHLDIAEDMPTALMEAVGQIDYDVCVFTGDFRSRTFGGYTAALDGMRRVREQLNGAVYGVLGNHDSIRMLPGLEDMDIRMLMNESLTLSRDGEAIHLAGVDDPHYYRADNLEKAKQGIPEQAVSILLAHSPEMYRYAAYADLDVMLCGHTHGGQICLPGGIPLICNANTPRALCCGAWRYQQLQGYTSSGSGACVVDVRINCPPEITVHCLRRSDLP